MTFSRLENSPFEIKQNIQAFQVSPKKLNFCAKNCIFFSGDIDRHVTPIALVFDELKDYLSESDLSLDYKIARSRNKKKKLLTNRNSKIFNGEVIPTNPQQGEN